MKTDDLIGLLAQDAEPVASHAIEQRLRWRRWPAWAGGLVLMLVLFGVRPAAAWNMALPVLGKKRLVFAALLATPVACRDTFSPGAAWHKPGAQPGVAGSAAAGAVGLAAVALAGWPGERLPWCWAAPGAVNALAIARRCRCPPWRPACGRCAARRPRGWPGRAPGPGCRRVPGRAGLMRCIARKWRHLLAVWYLAGMALPTGGAWYWGRVLRCVIPFLNHPCRCCFLAVLGSTVCGFAPRHQ